MSKRRKMKKGSKVGSLNRDMDLNHRDHEWCKHGTCATSLPTLKDELHYFNVTLGLHSFFNLAQ